MTDIDPTPTEPVTPAPAAMKDDVPDSAEPNLEPAPQPAAAPPQPDKEPAAAKPEPEPAFKSDPRNEIYARRSAQLKSEQEANDELFADRADARDPDAVERMRAEAAGQGLASDPGKSYKIKVYGEEREVPESAVIEAGVATLQKDAAAGRKMAEAARREAELRREEQRLLRVAENLRKGLDEHGQPLAPTKPPAPADASRGRTISKDKLEATVKALYSGDTEEATKALQGLVETISQNSGTPDAVSPEIVKSVEEAVVSRMESRQRQQSVESDISEANRIFREDYADISGDPDMLVMAQGLAGRLTQDPEWEGRSRAEIAREVGKRIRTKMSGANRGASAEVEARLTRKRAMPGAPNAHGRVPEPQTQRQFPSNQDYVQQLRLNSGSNSVR